MKSLTPLLFLIVSLSLLALPAYAQKTANKERQITLMLRIQEFIANNREKMEQFKERMFQAKEQNRRAQERMQLLKEQNEEKIRQTQIKIKEANTRAKEISFKGKVQESNK